MCVCVFVSAGCAVSSEHCESQSHLPAFWSSVEQKGLSLVRDSNGIAHRLGTFVGFGGRFVGSLMIKAGGIFGVVAGMLGADSDPELQNIKSMLEEVQKS